MRAARNREKERERGGGVGWCGVGWCGVEPETREVGYSMAVTDTGRKLSGHN